MPNGVVGHLQWLGYLIAPTLLFLSSVGKAWYNIGGSNQRGFWKRLLSESRELILITLVFAVFGFWSLATKRVGPVVGDETQSTDARILPWVVSSVANLTVVAVYMFLFGKKMVVFMRQHRSILTGISCLTVVNFLVGFALSVSSTCVCERTAQWELTRLGVYLTTFMLRGAGLSGYSVGLMHCAVESPGVWLLSPLLFLVPCTFACSLLSYASARRTLLFVAAVPLVGWTVPWALVDLMEEGRYVSFIVYTLCGTFVAILVHVGRWHHLWRRPVRNWQGVVYFLKYSEVRRRRVADPSFVLQRLQEMHPVFFGDATIAKHIVVVSHAWLSPTHGDPNGVHLDLILERIRKDTCPFKCTILDLWWDYYYLRGDDVLFFCDVSSLPQEPRSTEEEEQFRQGLALMSFLYSTFDVLVIDYIPKACDRDVPYLDRGWCWAEANQAKLAGRLQKFSSYIIKDLDDEAKERLTANADPSLKVGLWGSPPYSPEVLSDWEAALEFRETQACKGKIFSGGWSDFFIVLHQLTFFDLRSSFREALEADDLYIVKRLVEASNAAASSPTVTRENSAVSLLDRNMLYGTPDSVPLGGRGNSSRGLSLRAGPEAANNSANVVNAVFDADFKTPLHIAIRNDSIPMVDFLLDNGCIPGRNARGDLPWETNGFLSCGRAAQWARSRSRQAALQGRERPRRAGGFQSLRGEALPGGNIELHRVESARSSPLSFEV